MFTLRRNALHTNSMRAERMHISTADKVVVFVISFLPEQCACAEGFERDFSVLRLFSDKKETRRTIPRNRAKCRATVKYCIQALTLSMSSSHKSMSSI
jgi:hypothetical protein